MTKKVNPPRENGSRRVKVTRVASERSRPLRTPRPAWSLDPMETASAQETQVQAHLVEALELLQARQAGQDGERAERAGVLVQMALAQLAGEGEGPSIDARQARAFAAVLRDRRRIADLSQDTLAIRTGLSRSTIKNIEAGRTAPTRTTMLRLLAVPELGLQVRELTALAPSAGWKLNSWMAPRYEPLRMSADMVRLLNGPGGALEQTYLYLDHQSADDWLALSNSELYVETKRQACPLDQLAQKMARAAGGLGLDVVGLGVGDGKSEVRLVRHLAEMLPPGPRMTLNLLDISNALLSEAQRHAEQVLGDRVEVFTSHANLHDVGRYTGLHASAKPTRRRGVYTLLGYTVINLDNEVRFFQELAGCSSPGDFCVLDFVLAYAPADRPDEIRRVDPPLVGGMNPAYVNWLSGPIQRHCRGAQNIKLGWELTTACPVPGSYELDCFATVKMQDGSQRRFLMSRAKRYDAERLAKCLDELGWEPLATMRYGVGAEKSSAVMLLRRK